MGGRGSGGRNRKPTKVKKLEGNAGHRPLNQKEPEPRSVVPEIPPKLSANARAHWKRLVPLLRDELGILTIVDGDALAGYCTALVQWELAAAAIEKYGILCAQLDELTGTAILKVNPAVRVQSDALRQMRAFEAEFGLTPASRSRLRIDKKDDPTRDPLEDLFSGKDSGDVVQ